MGLDFRCVVTLSFMRLCYVILFLLFEIVLFVIVFFVIVLCNVRLCLVYEAVPVCWCDVICVRAGW